LRPSFRRSTRTAYDVTGSFKPRSFAKGEILQQSRFLETEETLADNDMIQEMDLKNLRSRRDSLGELLSKPDFDKDIDNFFKKLEETDPIKAIVLSTHLMVEEQLNLLLDLTLPDVMHLDLESRDGPKFSLKVKLAKASTVTLANDENWKLVIALNRLRNHFSHAINDHKTPKELAAFRKVTRQVCNPPENIAKDDRLLLRLAFANIMGFLVGVRINQYIFTQYVRELDIPNDPQFSLQA
jgi:hypothetical protein